MAWQVPPHEPVWRPMAAPRQASSWRDIPAWAMAAAASVLFLSGAAGGVATRVLWPVAPQASNAATSAPAAIPASVTTSDLARFREALLTDVRTEMDQRLVAVPAHATATAPASSQDLAAISDRLRAFEQWQRIQIGFNVELENKVKQIGTRTSNVDDLVELNRAAWRRISLER
jgi:hypothetical protein